jgi:hypothetical protein
MFNSSFVCVEHERLTSLLLAETNSTEEKLQSRKDRCKGKTQNRFRPRSGLKTRNILQFRQYGFFLGYRAFVGYIFQVSDYIRINIFKNTLGDFRRKRNRCVIPNLSLEPKGFSLYSLSQELTDIPYRQKSNGRNMVFAHFDT